MSYCQEGHKPQHLTLTLMQLEPPSMDTSLTHQRNFMAEPILLRSLAFERNVHALFSPARLHADPGQQEPENKVPEPQHSLCGHGAP